LEYLGVDWRWADRDRRYTKSSAGDLRAILRGVDFLLVIVTEEGLALDQALEAGVGVGLGKPMLIVSTSSSPLMPAPLEEVFYARVDALDSSRLEFLIKSFLNNTKRPYWRATRKEYWRDLDDGLYSDRSTYRRSEFGSAFEFKAVSLLDRLSADLPIEKDLSTKDNRKRIEIDAVIWAKGVDGPQPSPMLVEIKASASKRTVSTGIKQLEQFMEKTDVRSGLLITRSDTSLYCHKSLSGLIFVIGIGELEELVNSETFFQTLRYQRNKAAHGID
jgi:hypothetical protein